MAWPDVYPKAALPALADGEGRLGEVALDTHDPAVPVQVRVPKEKPPLLFVPKVLSDPHWLVELTVSSLRTAKPDEEGRLRPRPQAALDVVVGPNSVDRAMRIVQALISAIEARGASVGNAAKEGPRESRVELDGIAVPFSIREELNGREKELSARQKKEQERSPWKQGPIYVYSPNGTLTFTVNVPRGHGERMRWSDGKKQRLEDHLPRIVETLFQIAARLEEERRVREEQARRQQEWDRERHEKLRLIFDEEDRLKRLFAEMDSWDRSRRVKAYIRHVVRTIEAEEGMRAQPGSPLQKWADWAWIHAERLNPAVKRPHSIIDEKSKWQSSYCPG